MKSICARTLTFSQTSGGQREIGLGKLQRRPRALFVTQDQNVTRGCAGKHGTIASLMSGASAS